MKVAYIAHPISGDIKGNLLKVQKIGREINLNEPDVVPFAPYFFDCYALDDNVPEERARGIKNDIALLSSGVVTEVRLYGDRISNGMWHEVELAHKLGIQVRPRTPQTMDQYLDRYPNGNEFQFTTVKSFSKSRWTVYIREDGHHILMAPNGCDVFDIVSTEVFDIAGEAAVCRAEFLVNLVQSKQKALEGYGVKTPQE